jgi:hypothetical protein
MKERENERRIKTRRKIETNEANKIEKERGKK